MELRLRSAAAGVAILAMTALAVPRAAAGAEALDPNNGAYTLLLGKLLPDGQAVQVHLRAVNGQIRQAWAALPPDRASYYPAEGSKLTVAGGRLAGPLSVTVQSARYDCVIDAAAGGAGAIAGTYRCTYGDEGTREVKGAIGGEAAPAADITGPMRFDLDLGAVFGAGPERQCIASFTLEDGKVRELRLRPGQEGAAKRWAAFVVSSDLRLRGVELTGEINATVSSFSGVTEGGYLIKLDGAIACNAVMGTVDIRVNEGGARSNRFFGSVLPAEGAKPAPGQVLRLTLDGAVEGDKPLRIHLYERGGKFVGAAAFCHECSSLVHRVGVDGLKYESGRLSGELQARIEYDGKFPSFARDVPCSFNVDVKIDGGRLGGTYSGGYGLAGRGSGQVGGKLEPWGELQRRDAMTAGLNWPCWRGPTGSGSAPDSGRKLVGNLWKARLAWSSEESSVPGTWAEWHRGGLGGYSDFAVADGRAFLFYYWPGGTILHQAAYDHLHKELGIPLSQTGQRLYYLAEADDTIVSVDAATGRTLWKTVFRGRGLNHGYVHSRNSPQNTPCTVGGRVFAMGTAGNMYALDAASGEPLWDSDVDEWAVAIDQFKQSLRIPYTKAVYERSGKDYCLSGTNALACSSSTFADGVVACNDHSVSRRERRAEGCGLVGFDAATGKRLWRVGDCLSSTGNSPVRWVHRGKEYFVAACNRRAVGVEPRTGKVLWEVKGEVHHGGTPAACEDYVFLNGGKNTHGDSGYRYGQEGPVCLRVDPNGAQVAWKYSAEKYITGSTPSQMIVGSELVAGLARHGRGFTRIDLTSGRVIESIGGEGGYGPVAADGRIAGDSFSVIPLDANERRRALEEGVRAIATEGTSGWQGVPKASFVPFTMIDGRIFVRGVGRLFCYDLRADANELPLRGAPAQPWADAAGKPAAAPAAPAAVLPTDAGLLAALSGPHMLAREDALVGLRSLPPGRQAAMLPDLLRLMDEGNWYARTAAGELLRQLGTAAASAAPRLEKLLLAAAASGRKGQADLAAATLAKVAPEWAARVAPLLAGMLADGNESAVATARWALEVIGPMAAPAAGELAKLVQHKDAVRARAACRALAAIGPAAAEGALPALRAALGGSDADLAREAARALAAMGPGAAPAAADLARLLEHEDAMVVTQAALAISAMGDRAAAGVPAALAAHGRIAAQAARPEKTTRTALLALTAILVNNPSAKGALAEALKHTDARGGAAAIGKVMKASGEEAIPELLDAMRDSRDAAQLKALSQTLATLGPKAVPAIEDALLRADGAFKEALTALLHELKMKSTYGPKR
jgi:outer membrane protein assembly factor BamB